MRITRPLVRDYDMKDPAYETLRACRNCLIELGLLIEASQRTLENCHVEIHMDFHATNFHMEIHVVNLISFFHMEIHGGNCMEIHGQKSIKSNNNDRIKDSDSNSLE